MARAVYRRNHADIFLFDDPFAAVDVGVGRHLFEHAVCGRLAGKTRLIVLNSHLHLLPRFDRVVVVALEPECAAGGAATGSAGNAGQGTENSGSGRIVAVGTFDEISARFPEMTDKAHADVEEVAAPPVEGVSGSVSVSVSASATAAIAADPVAKPAAVVAAKSAVAKLIENEDRQTGSVASDVYLAYFRLSGGSFGLCWLAMLLSLFVVNQVIRIGADVWLSLWSGGRVWTDQSLGFWIGVFGAWSAGTALMAIGRQLMYTATSVGASRALHDSMFTNLLRAPVTLFFDVTPVGRIVNRFSRDLDQVDSAYVGISKTVWH
jgi:ABC-type multidrug transport system fused ATPase/permease subunit